jgi:uncharacterized membrane protein
MKMKSSLLKLSIFIVFICFSKISFAANEFSTNITFLNWLFIAALLFIIIITYNVLSNIAKTLKHNYNEGPSLALKSKLDDIIEIKNVFFYISLLFIFIYLAYKLVQGTSWESHVVEWLNLVIRWAHIVFGIAWIGASFYFNFLENSLNRTENLREELAGNLWAVHGGGFYYLEKYKIAPKELPKDLHWFKYEAYFTWLSGIILLVIVYYLDANVYLIDKSVLDIPENYAIGIGLISLALGWIVYDILCKTLISLNAKLFWVVLFIFLAGFSWFFLHVFSARAAYIHVGALIGTMMVGNVFRVIIPSQKAMVNAAKVGQMPDGIIGKRALMRSKHNNYLTLPVIFIMISNHFPSTFGNAYNWILLIALSLCSVLVKEYLNKIEKGEKAVWIMPVAVIGMIALTFVTAPKTNTVCKEGNPPSFSEVKTIIEKRCTQCHSANPTDDVFKVAPNGVLFDTQEQIIGYKDRILNRTAITKTMPQANKTEMTQEERDVIQCWIDSGAKL